MKLDKQAGFVSGMLIALIAVSVILVGALGFGAWAFMSRQDYKNNSDQKAEKAADERQAATEEADAVKYAEEAKNPLTSHKAPDQFGGVTIQYPKTWSAYAIEDGTGNSEVDDYFHPSVVPNVGNKSNAFALRVQVVEKTYDEVLKTYKNEVEGNKLTAAPYAFAKVPNIVGTRLEGQVDQNKQGVLIIVPMRNLTLKVWTESANYLTDFTTIILPNLTFSP